MSLVVVQQGAVNIVDRVSLAFDVGKVGVAVYLEHADTIGQYCTEHDIANLLHFVGDEPVQLWLLDSCMVLTAKVFLPGFWVATVTASPTIRG